MDTEQIFSTQAIDESLENLFDDDEEIPATQFFTAKDQIHLSNNHSDSVQSTSQFASQFSAREVEKISASQNVIRKMHKIVYKPVPSQYHQPRKLTDDEIQMRKELRKNLIVPMEIDHTLYNPNEKIKRPKDNIPTELRDMMLKKGYVSANEAHQIMSQSKNQPKSSQSTDYEDIDGDTIEEIEQAYILDYSLGSLTQKLNSSKRAAELIESSLPQNDPVDLDVTKIDLEAFSSDDDDDNGFPVCTEELEFDFDCATENLDSSRMYNFPDTERPSCSKYLDPFSSRMISGIGNTGMFSCYSPPSGKPSSKDDSLKKPETMPKARDNTQEKYQSTFSGFGLASGKSIKIEETKINHFIKVFEQNDCEIQSEIKIESEASFKTPVAVKSFKVPSSTPIQLKTNKFACSSSTFTPTSSIKLKEEKSDLKFPMTGFATAGGRNFKLNESSLKRAAILFEREDESVVRNLQELLKDDDTEGISKSKKIRLNFEESLEPPNTKKVIRFDPLKNNTSEKITESQEMIRIVEICSKMDMTQDFFKVPDSPSTLATNKNSTLPLAASSMTPQSSKNIRQLNSSQEKITRTGFESTNGGKLKISDKSLKASTANFEKEDKRVGPALKRAFLDEELVKTPEKPKSMRVRLNFDKSPFGDLKKSNQPPKPPSVEKTSDKMTDSQEVSSIIEMCLSLDDMTQEFFKKPESLSNSSTAVKTPGPSRVSNTDSPLAVPIQKLGFTSAAGKNFTLDESNLKKFEEIFENADKDFAGESLDDAVNSPENPLKRLRLSFDDSPIPSSPFMMNNFKKGINKHSTPLIRKSITKQTLKTNEKSHLPKATEHSINNKIDTLQEVESPKKRKFVQVRLLNKFNESADSNSSFDLTEIDSIEDQYKTIYKIEDKVKLERKSAMEQQRQLVKEKADGDRAAMTGTVFMRKSSSNNRQKLSDYVAQEQPKNLNRHQITMKNAIDYKFLMENHVSEAVCTQNTAGIFVGDNARLVLNEQSKVGLEEIKCSFLTSIGVDPKLVSEKWIENAYKMILMKLAWLENSFDKFEKYELLSPDTLLLQMKYRYDREIDRGQRPAIKKLVELDDVPCRRMVLRVVDVHKVAAVGYELELSDGWYSIRCTIDASLADAVDRQKIKVGTKLVTSCGELLSCSGHDPLEMPGNVRLKIHANATRRGSWDMKMGFTKNPMPIRVPLDSVLSSGGVIGKLTVVVTHVYQIVYVDHSNDKKEFRSEKLQHRIDNKQDIRNFAVVERVSYEVEQEEKAKLRKRIEGLQRSHTDFEHLSPEDICDLLDFESDADELKFIQNGLTESTLKAVQNVRDARRQEVYEKIRKKLGEKNRNISQFLRFRVVDAVRPNKTAVISWWSPNEELSEMITEGKLVEVCNASAAPFNREIQVTAGKSSVIKVLKSQVPRDKFSKFFRRETKISEINSDFKPQQDEFDLGCVVVRVEQEAINDLLKVYVADEDRNILCINFWSSLTDNALDDVVVKGNVVYARNLQWRSSNAFEKLPQSFVCSDLTLFILHPKNEDQNKRLMVLRNAIKDKAEFLIKCNEKIAELLTGNVSIINKENQREQNNNLPVKQEKTSLLGRPDFSQTFGSFMRSSQKSSKSNDDTNKPRKRRLGTNRNRTFDFSADNRSKRQPNFNSLLTKSRNRK